MKWNSRTRCALVCLGFVLLFSAFSFRLIYLQMIKHDQYAGLAAEKHVYKQPIFAERGTILDAITKSWRTMFRSKPWSLTRLI